MCVCVGGGGVPGPSIILLHGYNLSSISMYDTRKQSDKNFKIKYEYLEGSGGCCARAPTGTKLSVQEWVPYHRAYRSMYNKELN